MPLDLNGYLVSSATPRFPRWGVPSADIVLVDTPPLAVGSRCTLRIGDIAIAGTLRPGGEFGATSYFTVLAGAGRWDTQVPARAYQDPGGVLLSKVVADLARETRSKAADPTTGETVVLDVVDRSLGTQWTREAGLASEALDALTRPAGSPPGTPGEWWVATDGVTHVGPRATRNVTAPPELTVSSYDPSTKHATIRVASEAIAALLPGAVLSAEGLPAPLAIGSVIIRAQPGDFEVSAFGEKGIDELLRDIIASISSPSRYHVIAPMTVAEVQSTRASVQPQPGDVRAVDIPGTPLLSQVYGVPGLSAVLAAGARVYVVWPGGDPASPTIALYDPSVRPQSLTFDADGDIALGANAAVLAKGIATNANFNTLRLAINALGGMVDPLPSVSTTKAKGE